MRKQIAFFVLVFLLFASCGPKVAEPPKTVTLPNPAKSGEPTQSEKLVINEYVPQGFKLSQARRVDTEPAFVFAAYLNEPEIKFELRVFRFTDGKLDKVYSTGPMMGDAVMLKSLLDKDYWGTELGGKIICPVLISFGGNAWENHFIKLLTVSDGVLSELDVRNPPGLPVDGLIEVSGKTYVAVLDPSFEFGLFDPKVDMGLCHACSPARVLIYGEENGAWVDVTAKHPEYIKSKVEEQKAGYQSLPEDEGEGMIGNALGVYIHAEAGKLVKEYMPDVEKMLLGVKGEFEGKAKAVLGKLKEVAANGKPLVDLGKYQPQNDIRWKKILWQNVLSKDQLDLLLPLLPKGAIVSQTLAMSEGPERFVSYCFVPGKDNENPDEKFLTVYEFGNGAVRSAYKAKLPKDRYDFFFGFNDSNDGWRTSLFGFEMFPITISSCGDFCHNYSKILTLGDNGPGEPSITLSSWQYAQRVEKIDSKNYLIVGEERSDYGFYLGIPQAEFVFEWDGDSFVDVTPSFQERYKKLIEEALQNAKAGAEPGTKQEYVHAAKYTSVINAYLLAQASNLLPSYIEQVDSLLKPLVGLSNLPAKKAYDAIQSAKKTGRLQSGGEQTGDTFIGGKPLEWQKIK